nr:reverse transcriptase domain-containing protein [Tanacetum cinerariifolium]
MPTKIELTLEQSQQGVSNDVLNLPEHLSDSKVLTVKMEILLEPTSNMLLVETELEEARTQIARLQKKQMGHEDEVVLARVRISTLEMIIEDIQVHHRLDIRSLLEAIRELKNKMAPKRTSTSTTPAMTQVAIRKLVVDSVATALEVQVANMANADNTNRHTEPRKDPVARKCSYKEFMSCQPFNFKDTEGAVGLICWFERTESIFFSSNYTEDCKVKFATGTLTEEALSWSNSFSQPIRIEEAYKITWSAFKKLLINKYYPRTRFKKIEDEFYNLTVKGNDLKTYVRDSRDWQFYVPLWCQILRK